jgi:hypothetical protein
MGFTAIQAFGHGELGRALRADATGPEGVECLPTFAALPEFANGRRGFACRTSKANVTGQFCET